MLELFIFFCDTDMLDVDFDIYLFLQFCFQFRLRFLAEEPGTSVCFFGIRMSWFFRPLLSLVM